MFGIPPVQNGYFALLLDEFRGTKPMEMFHYLIDDFSIKFITTTATTTTNLKVTFFVNKKTGGFIHA